MAYRFDPAKEPPTVEVEILPYRYVRVQKFKTLPDGKIQDEPAKDFYGRWDVVLDPATGKKDRKFVSGDCGRLWVPPRLAKMFCDAGADKTMGIEPMARVVKTVKTEEAATSAA